MIFKKTGEIEYLFPFKAFKDPFQTVNSNEKTVSNDDAKF